jgi:hypothetical protein
MLQTEFPFTLPRGYVDAEGNLHREGVMRLATAYDEIAPMKDPRAGQPGYLVIILLARVILPAGRSETISQEVIERLFAAIWPTCRISTSASTAPAAIGSW